MNNRASDNRDLLTRTSNLLRTALNQLETGNVSETTQTSVSCAGQGRSTSVSSGQFSEEGRSASSVSGQGRSASEDFR